MALQTADWKEVADAFKNLILDKGIKAHLCHLTYLFFSKMFAIPATSLEVFLFTELFKLVQILVAQN